VIRAFFQHWTTLISLISASITVYVFSTDAAKDADTRQILALLVIGGIAILFLLENLYLRLVWSRKARYASALEAVDDGFQEVHRLVRVLPTPFESITDAFSRMCDHVARAYTLVTSANCGVSIKILGQEVGEGNILRPKLVGFARDNASKKKRSTDGGKVKHWLASNSDFLQIWRQAERGVPGLFFSNNLPLLDNYSNTSFAAHGKLPELNMGPLSWFVRLWTWPLPYKSTIVVPICPCGHTEQELILGFLCVDSPAMWSFRRRHDARMLKGIAEGIYNTLRIVYEERTLIASSGSTDTEHDEKE
jgi:hypothetical protein